MLETGPTDTSHPRPRRGWERSGFVGLAAIAFVFVLALILFEPSLLGGKVFGSGDNIFLWPPFAQQAPPGFIPNNPLLTDPVATFIPPLLLARHDILHGILPLWNPDIGAGRPFIFQQQATLYPINWLAFTLPFWSALGWIAAAKILVAGVGTYLFCRALGLRAGSSLLGAIAFAFGSYFFVWLEHPHTNVWAMLPWMYLATRRTCRTGELGAVAALGLAGGLACLGNHPESTSIVFVATAAYGLFELATGPRLPGTLRRTGLFVLGLALGLGVGAVVLIPLEQALRIAPHIQRGGGDGAPFSTLWTFFFPELWGSPNKSLNLGPWNFNERTTYFGAAPLLFAAATLGRSRPREQWFFYGLIALIGVTIFNVPWWAHWVSGLPGVDLVWLARMRIVLVFGCAVLAAFGLDRWLGAARRERRTMLLLMIAAAVIPLLAWLPRHTSGFSSLGTAFGQLPALHRGVSSVNAVALGSVWRWTLICAITIGSLALLTRFQRARWMAAAVVAVIVGVTAADLLTLDHGYHGSEPRSVADPPVPESIRYLQRVQGDQRVTASESALPSDIQERYGLRDARVGFDIPPQRYASLWEALGVYGGGGYEGFDAALPHAQQLANLFDVRYVLLPPGEPTPSWLQTVLTTKGGTVGLNRTALPRAWVAYDWQPAGSRSAALSRTLGSSTARLEDEPVIEGAPTPPHQPLPATPARVIADGPETVTITADARQAGYVVLDDSAYPGWHASVDGHSVAWQDANEDFRAVPISAGEHTISFTYRPGSVIVGAAITVVSLIVIVALAILGGLGRRRRRSTGPSTTASAPDLVSTPG